MKEILEKYCKNSYIETDVDINKVIYIYKAKDMFRQIFFCEDNPNEVTAFIKYNAGDEVELNIFTSSEKLEMFFKSIE